MHKDELPHNPQEIHPMISVHDFRRTGRHTGGQKVAEMIGAL